MKFRLFTLAAISLVAAGNAYAQTTWTMPTAYPDTNFHTKNLKQFADEVAKETDGKLKITIHSGGALIKMPEIKRAVQTGQVQLGEIFIGTMANEAPLYAFDSMPFMNSGYKDAYKVWEAVRPQVTERLKKQKLTVLYSVAWPAQGIYTKKPITSINDFKGMKFRSPSISTAELVKRVGAIPTVIQAADVPQAFMTGLVDAMMTSSSTGVDTQAWDYLTTYYDVPTMYPQNIVFVNNDAWEKLDPQTRDIVQKAAKRAEERGWKMSANESSTNTAKLKDKLQVSELPPEVLAVFKQKGQEITSEWLKGLDPREADAIKAAIN